MVIIIKKLLFFSYISKSYDKISIYSIFILILLLLNNDINALLK